MAKVSIGAQTTLNDASGVDFVYINGTAPSGNYTDVVWEIDAQVFNSTALQPGTHWGVVVNCLGADGRPEYDRRGENLWQNAQGVIFNKDGYIGEEAWFRDANGTANAFGHKLRDTHIRSRYYRVRITSYAVGGPQRTNRVLTIEQRNAGESWRTLLTKEIGALIQNFRTANPAAFLFGEPAAAGSITVTCTSMTNG